MPHRPTIGSEVIVTETTPLQWLNCGDPNEKHWAAGRVGEVVRHNHFNTDLVRVRFPAGIAPHGLPFCHWFHFHEVVRVS